jgi:hypothetical protein
MRRSFVVQIHADGTVIVENLRTRERRSIDDLASIGDQISTWIDETASPVAGGTRSTVTAESRGMSG